MVESCLKNDSPEHDYCNSGGSLALFRAVFAQKCACQDLTYAQSVELPNFLLADNGLANGYLRKL